MRHLNRKIWPYSINLHFAAEADDLESVKRKISMDNWCSAHVGTRFRDWYSYNLNNTSRTYAFKTEEELLIFKIRWNYK